MAQQYDLSLFQEMQKLLAAEERERELRQRAEHVAQEAMREAQAAMREAQAADAVPSEGQAASTGESAPSEGVRPVSGDVAATVMDAAAVETPTEERAPALEISPVEGEHASQPQAEQNDRSLQGVRVLLVDDIDINRELMRGILKKQGIDVSIALDGRDAVECVEAARPGAIDLILMDIQMPQMDGCEAAKQIRRLPDRRKSQIPILAMTANIDPERKRLFQRAGINGCIEKPVNVDELIRAMKGIR